MKVFAVLRGFPGLGRVISGLTILETLKKEYNANTKVYTYMQGETALDLFDFQNFMDNVVLNSEITSLGLDPVGPTSVKIMNEILSWKPDIILIDGEPLLINLIDLCYDKKKVISLLNPADLNNESLPYSTRKFFQTSFLNCACGIVHGYEESDYSMYDNVLSVNTILRNKIIELKKYMDSDKKKSNNITCILGGGSKSHNNSFIDSTLDIGRNIIKAAKLLQEYHFDIYSNDNYIFEMLNKEDKSSNVLIKEHIGKEKDLYLNADLVICRAGRNTTSEIMYLNIPCILMAAGNDYRASEQRKNINNIIEKYNYGFFQYDNESYLDLVEIIKEAINLEKIDNKFQPGNKVALTRIIEIYNNNKNE